ncbi:MAG TPA: FRG domain-containing protein [bacterium]|nr:FRG domain-containing protein [bacterium]
MKIETVNDFQVAKPFFLEATRPIEDIVALLKYLREFRDKISTLYEKNNIKLATMHSWKYGLYFRGQGDYTKPLIPSVGRERYSVDYERDILHRFRRRSVSHYNRILSWWETIFLARHHELPTRLIDWSTNPFVAAFFASKSLKHRKKDGAIWVLVRQLSEDHDLNVFESSPINKYKYCKDIQFTIEGVKLIYPFYISPRMTAQGSLFTIQDQPEEKLEGYSFRDYTRQNFDVFHIRKWRVPPTGKEKLIKELEEVGINNQTLLPDLLGLAEGITEIDQLRRV